MQPGKISITVNFASDEANGVSGRSTVRTASLDGMLQAIKTCTDAVIDSLALIQRDDGNLMDGSVKTFTLSSDVLALISSTAFTVRGAWVGGTAYNKGDVVLQGAIVYVCFVAHTGGVFANDLAAGKWGSITTTSNAATTSFAPTSTIVANNVQAAIAELDLDLRPTESILNRDLYNGL